MSGLTLLIAGLAVNAVEHEEREERISESRTRAAYSPSGRLLYAVRRLPKLSSPLLRTTILWMLLTVLLLPSASLWHSVFPGAFVTLKVDVFASAGLLAFAALRPALRKRAGVFSLMLCSGVATATVGLMLYLDGLWHLKSQFGEMGRPIESLSSLPWLPRSLTALALSHEVHAPLSSPDAGYFVGVSLVFVTALAMGSRLSRSSLFEKPVLEVRHIAPLAAPLPFEVRSRLRIAAFAFFVAVPLALWQFGRQPGAAVCLAVAVAFYVWGWHCRVMGSKQVLASAGMALGASALMLGLASLSGDPRVKIPAQLLAGDASFASTTVLALLLLSVMFLLRRPPAHLVAVLGHAPAWGWMMLSSVLAAFAMPFMLPAGTTAALLLVLPVAAAWFFLWIENTA